MNRSLQRIGDFFALQIKKILPDSFVFAILLTLLTAFLAFQFTETNGTELLDFWVNGLYSSKILSFGFFMIMVLSFGYSMGASEQMKRFFTRLSARINSPSQVYLAITLTSLGLNLINWGLAPVTALFTVELCKRVRGVDFRLACAALYSGMLIWHGGLSSSAAVMMASEDTASIFIESGIIDAPIPVSETLLHPLNLCLIGASSIALPLLILGLRPEYEERYDASLRHDLSKSETRPVKNETKSLADRLNTSRLVSLMLVLLLSAGLVYRMHSTGFDLTALSLLMMAAALLFQGTPIRFVEVMKDAIRGSSDIVVQFPLFGGIMGIFIGTGLGSLFADQLVNLGDAQSMPWLAFMCSSVVNLFIPSGGGEWLVLGPPLLEAANTAGADLGKIIIAFAYGDSLTNLMNPFWTLTFLPIMGRLIHIETRDFMGYTVFICFVFYAIESLIIWFV